ncbi:hypothetical protein HCB37_02790 [Listeria booriae]|uniref:helix-turn-helix domain-containing protein n=1 Tax=Listeria booriae TaxID=1552123 RepID=UPI001627B9CB|nr:helix-turn-helix domain-containing protein [Listeria booriae]MBC1975938.1 hypothetical protein [Listeria booriae]MBC2033756.1 hypothetical protein [Listeria booriae]MBC2046955.1 hypothetical protein [Listeria booriae]MBC2263434.1 hypothetical protein [Listeria booriae]
MEWANVDVLDDYLLHVIAAFPRKRKPAFLYAIVTGKRTGQAVQDSHLFDVTRFFGCVPMMRQRYFDARLGQLRDAGWIALDEDGVSLLGVPESGFAERFADLDGFSFQSRTAPFFERLLLAVQVFSNWKHERKRYLPIVRDEETQFVVKQWLGSLLQEETRSEVRTAFYRELTMWLQDAKADLYVPRFSGGDYIGKTGLQIADELDMEPWAYYFEWLDGLHKLLAQLERFPMLQKLMPDATRELTTSAQETLYLLRQGLDTERVMAIRRLKWSTIQDHLVEIAATVPDFSVGTWIDEAAVDGVAQGTWQSLKEIKEAFGELDYFQIRLALIVKRSGAKCN